MKPRLPWILFAISLALNLFFGAGVIYSKLEAERGYMPPEALVRRASALVPDPPGRNLAAWLQGLFTPIRQPLGWSGAAVGILLACAVGFQLGQIGYASSVTLEQLEVAEAGFVLDPAEEEIL